MSGKRRGWPRSTRGFILATSILVGRLKRELFMLMLPALASTLVSLPLILNSASMMFTGRLSTIWDRISAVRDRSSSDDTSFILQEYWSELGAIEWNLDNQGLSMLLGGILLYLATSFIHIAAVSRMYVRELQGHHCSVMEALRWGIRRISRLSAFFSKIVGLGIALVIILAAISALGIALLVTLTPIAVALLAIVWLSVLALGAAQVLAPGVLVIAFIASAVGPTRSPLRYAMRIVRGRFWETLGKIYLIALFAISVSIISELVISEIVADRWYASNLIGQAIGLANITVSAAGVCFVYHDLGEDVA